MKQKVSKALKRYNYLFGETGAAYHEICLKLGLPDSTVCTLYAILENGGSCPLQHIGHCTGLTKQTINSAIRKLEAEGAVRLERAGAKNKTVYLTESGKILAEQTAGRVLGAEDEIFASWPRDDVEKYLELAERFMLALKEKAGEM